LKRFSLTEPALLDADALLAFFAADARDLPWRGVGATPWRVLVSEVMLQQTPVSRVRPVFDEWLVRWPVPADLAADPAGDAVRAWGRLGYPRRALRLWQAATMITADFGGTVPAAVPQLLSLPGVGQYTARAVAAFGFGQRAPVVDTNVRRVLNRVVRATDDAEPATAGDLALMESLLPADPATAVRLSAAVMELGALVCTANNPRCSGCPLAASCGWLRAGRPASMVQRRPQAWHGTDRQVRGRIMALLREADEPLEPSVLAAAWQETTQRSRCLQSLLADGLAEQSPDGLISLPR
jgi:A/G-specific adenine glycosylase